MTFFQHEFSHISLFFFCSLILSIILLLLSYVVSTSSPDSEKLSAYECGFDPYEDARNTFDIRFYLLALLFLIFDLETVFFLPWSINLSFLTLESFWGMFDFILELLIGFIYAWIVGALEWE